MLTSRTIPFGQLPDHILSLLQDAPEVTFAGTAEELLALAVPPDLGDWVEVAYDTPGKGRVVEARVCRVRNGINVVYPEPYMRRRDPDCMLIGDDGPTDQERYSERFGESFEGLRQQTLEWLRGQPLAAFAFSPGKEPKAFDAVAICPANAGFFAYTLALIQGILPLDSLAESFSPTAFILVAPPFRHTHFKGRQVVVHNRLENCHELFSYNLYPGPSAKKGVYGMLLHQGESEGWITAHCSTVKVTTPYDNHVVFMHEGASGGGKSEMLQYPHRESDGRLLLGRNIVTNERRYFTLPRGCELQPVTDDMGLCHRTLPPDQRKLNLCDAEQAWFVRVNHIKEYGTDPTFERLTIHSPEPLVFLSIDAVPGSTALIWEHLEDAPGKRCPNPRVVIPRRIIPGVVEGDVTVDVRSFGVRAPACTREKPTYGIMGLFHILPPALAWLWRLTAPRGHDNPSIVYSGEGIPSEGVGSFWPFATGRRVEFANLLLKQILATSDTLYVLTPNQHIGAWRVGFMPQWLCREYLARRGPSKFRPEQLTPTRCPLLGYTLNSLMIEGSAIGSWFLQVETQPEVGRTAYDAGARQLSEFFKHQLELYRTPDLDEHGRRIIECCMDGGTVADYEALSRQS
ncbi:MAG: DUF4914 family protein [Candidatus Sumerlaeaceae bacterium]|nr:DUF4914 family protein [Candidatus Sumerlaeaceae bacterium]